jgi:hypothetical protein
MKKILFILTLIFINPTISLTNSLFSSSTEPTINLNQTIDGNHSKYSLYLICNLTNFKFQFN